MELRCEHPPELRGRVFLDLDPEQFCDQPLVVKLGIQDIQPFSVLVSWQSRNHSGLHGYHVAYYSVDDAADEVTNFQLKLGRVVLIQFILVGDKKAFLLSFQDYEAALNESQTVSNTISAKILLFETQSNVISSFNSFVSQTFSHFTFQGKWSERKDICDRDKILQVLIHVELHHRKCGIFIFT